MYTGDTSIKDINAANDMFNPHPDLKTPLNHEAGIKEYEKHLKINLNDMRLDMPKDKEEKMLNNLKPGNKKQIEKYLAQQRKLASHEAIMQCKSGIHAIKWKNNKWYIQLKEKDGKIVVIQTQPDWMDKHINHKVLKFAQNTEIERDDNDEFIIIDREKSPQDKGKNN